MDETGNAYGDTSEASELGRRIVALAGGHVAGHAYGTANRAVGHRRQHRGQEWIDAVAGDQWAELRVDRLRSVWAASRWPKHFDKYRDVHLLSSSGLTTSRPVGERWQDFDRRLAALERSVQALQTEVRTARLVVVDGAGRDAAIASSTERATELRVVMSDSAPGRTTGVLLDAADSDDLGETIGVQLCAEGNVLGEMDADSVRRRVLVGVFCGVSSLRDRRYPAGLRVSLAGLLHGVGPGLRRSAEALQRVHDRIGGYS